MTAHEPPTKEVMSRHFEVSPRLTASRMQEAPQGSLSSHETERQQDVSALEASIDALMVLGGCESGPPTNRPREEFKTAHDPSLPSEAS